MAELARGAGEAMVYSSGGAWEIVTLEGLDFTNVFEKAPREEAGLRAARAKASVIEAFGQFT